jgi:uncharacterized repeat protein (TIGR03803 family)
MRLTLVALILAYAAHPVQAQTAFTTIHDFTGTSGDGFSPYAPLVLAGRVFHGTTSAGGEYGSGTIFSLAPPASPGGDWTETLLYTFTGGLDGSAPQAGLAIGPFGILYGTTIQGGTNRLGGTVFSLTPPQASGASWTEAVLHNFGEHHDGINPLGGLVIGVHGDLFGTTGGGGRYNSGTVFKLRAPASPGGAWTEEVLYNFTGGADGNNPQATLAIDPATETLYGTTNTGGSALLGTVFSVTPPTTSSGAWTETVLHNFAGSHDGIHPNALLLAQDGVLYGTSHGIGTNYGAAFSLTPPAVTGGDWTFNLLHDFTGSPDGSEPGAGLIMAVDGTLYGTTQSGGTGSCLNGCGTIFSLTSGSPWVETVLYSFNHNGNAPGAPVVFGDNGSLYGTTKFGGATGGGTAFALQMP